MDIAARFGQNLAHARRSAGITQEELGRLAAVHRTEVGLLERGLRVARVGTLAKICSALSIPADQLLEGIEWKPGDTSEGSFEVSALEPGPGA